MTVTYLLHEICPLILMISVFIRLGEGTFHPLNVANESAHESAGVKLAAWHFNEFEIFFSIILSLLATVLFKMYYPKIPIVPEYIPQSLVLIVIGVIFGAVFSVASARQLEETLWKLTPEMFFHFLLPPIVLEASYSLYNRTFLDYLGSILIYAVIGTVLNFLIIGPVMYGLDKAGAMGVNRIDISLNSYLLFASLIVAVDPVAVLAIFQDIGVEPGLYYMVFGESLLNDAVTVVLYRIMSEFVGLTTVEGVQIGLGIGSFFTISLGGLLVGVIFGVVSSFLTRWTGHFGSFLIILIAYFSYIMGDTLGWSGIIAMIGCGLVQADYAFHNISSSALSSIRLVVKEISEISESFIFFLIGVQLFSEEILWSTGFCLWGLIVCLVARTIVVFALTFIINHINVNNLRVSLKQQAILVYGGLRGAVAFSLGLLVEHDRLGADGENVRKIIVTATLFVILFTVGVNGLTMKPLVRWFRIKLAGQEELSLWKDLNGNVIDHTLAGMESIVGSNGRNRMREYFTRVDDRFIRHWLTRHPETHNERIVKTYETMALKLHYATIHPSKSAAHLEGLPEIIRQKHLAGNNDSPLQLSGLITSASDPHLLDYFATQRLESSAVSLTAMAAEEAPYGPSKLTRVKFDASVKPDREKPVTNPEWRRRTSLVDNGRHEEPFQSQLFNIMKSKKIVSDTQSRRRAMKNPPKTSTDDDDEEDLETAANTALNKKTTKPGDKRDGDGFPRRDYPSNAAKFVIGGD